MRAIVAIVIFITYTGNFALGQQYVPERYNTTSYSVNEGLLQTSIIDAAFDENNFLWLSFPNGIQKFDGKTFYNVPLQAGLPDDKSVYFFKCHDGSLLVKHTGGISRYNVNTNRFNLVYATPPGEETPPLFAGQDGQVLYLYTADGRIKGFDCKTFSQVSVSRTPVIAESGNKDYLPKISNIINHRVAILYKKTIYLWDLKADSLIGQSAMFSNLDYFFLVLKNNNELLYYGVGPKLVLKSYNFTSRTSTVVAERMGASVLTFRSNIYKWKDKTLLSVFNHVYISDTLLKGIKAELVDFQGQPVAGNASVSRLLEDNYGNLYLTTINEGLKRVARNYYDLKYYGTGNKAENFILSVLPDKAYNRVLAGTYGNGLMIYDTLQRLVKHIYALPGEGYSFSSNTIIKDNAGNYIFFVFGKKEVFRLSNDLSTIEKIKIDNSHPGTEAGVSYYSNALFSNPTENVMQTQGQFYRTNLSNSHTTEYAIADGKSISGVCLNGYIITHSNDQLVYYDSVTFAEVKRIALPATGGVRSFTKDAAGNLYIGTNKGIFKTDADGNVSWHISKQNGLADECIYAMLADDEGSLWCSTNQGLIKVRADHSFIQLKKEDGLQENEFNTNVAARSADGEFFFGGVRGLTSFYPQTVIGNTEEVKILVTSLRVNNVEAFRDTAIWNMSHLTLPYDQNLLAFDFIAMGRNHPGQYIYQYKMKGIDGQWIRDRDLQTVRYFLPPGDYVFQIYASRFFDRQPKPLKEISIHISSPFWKTWWFITLASFVLMAVFVFLTYQYNYEKFRRKIEKMEGEQQLQTERQRIALNLHDSIGAYANAIIYSTELLENEKNEEQRHDIMKDLKFSSRDIITSLRETIWALKKDNYTAEDCLFRIRNFTQSLSRHYKHISFNIQGAADAAKHLNHIQALNMVRIVQETITNAIKHAEAKNIVIISNFNAITWMVSVMDDGRGFDTNIVLTAERGNGLKNISKRSKEAGFEVSILSNPGKGTTVTITT